MSIITITILDSDGYKQDFTLGGELEKLLDQINFLMAKDRRIARIVLIDQNQYIELPLEAFDGQPFVDDIHELQKEWESILGIK